MTAEQARNIRARVMEKILNYYTNGTWSEGEFEHSHPVWQQEIHNFLEALCDQKMTFKADFRHTSYPYFTRLEQSALEKVQLLDGPHGFAIFKVMEARIKDPDRIYTLKALLAQGSLTKE